MTDRSLSQDREARQRGCIHQFPITAPYSEQQPGDCERCELPWAEVPYRKQVAFSGGRYGGDPQPDTDRLARIRSRFAQTSIEVSRIDMAWLLLEVDRLQASRENWATETVEQSGLIGVLRRELAGLTAERDQLRADRATGSCSCYPNPLDHEGHCPRGVEATVPPPHFDRGLRFNYDDGQVYNLHRDYTDRDGTLWRCTGRDDDDPLWVRSSTEMGWTIDVIVQRHGPLTLVPDAFFDATDEQLADMVAGSEPETDRG